MTTSNLGEARVPIRATLEKLDQDLTQARSKIGKALTPLRDGWAGLQKAVTGAGVAVLATAGVVAGGIAFTVGRAAVDFQNATAAIIAGTGASGQALSEMEDIARNLAGTSAGLGRDFGELGTVIAEVNTRTGLTGESLEDLSSRVLNVSRLTGTDAPRNVALLTRALGDWDISADNAAQTLDVLFAAGQETGVQFDRLQELIVSYGVPMRNFGFSFEESAALLGKWEKEGVNVELVMGSLRQATMGFARDGIDLREGLEATIEAIQGAGSASEATAIAMDVFGARAGADMAAAIREGRFDIEDLVATLQDSEGALEDASQRTLTFAERMEIMQGRVVTALIPVVEMVLGFAEKTLPKIEEVLSTHVLPAIEKFNHFLAVLKTGLEGGIDPLDALNNALIAAFGPDVAEAIMDIVGRVQEFIEQAMKVVNNVIEVASEFFEWKDVMIALGIVIGAIILGVIGPLLIAIGKIILVTALLVAGVKFFRTAWEEDWGGVATFLTDLWENTIKPALETLWEWLQNDLPDAVAELRARWEEGIDALREPVDRIKTAWGTFVDAVTGFWNWLTGRTFTFDINLPSLPSWATPGSPLPIHTAWKNFDRDMASMRIEPQMNFAMADTGGGAGVVINVDARNATDPAAVKAAAMEGANEALAQVGLQADGRMRTR